MRTVDPALWQTKLKTHNLNNRETWKKKRLSPEMIFRLSLKAAMKEFAENSSMVVLRKMADFRLYTLARIFWSCIFVIVLILIVTTFVDGFRQTWRNPLMVSQLTMKFPANTLPYPAVALCNINLIKQSRVHWLRETIKNKFNVNLHHDTDVQIKKMGALIDFRVDETLVSFAEFIASIRNYTTIDMREFMLELTPRCSDMLVRCKFKGVLRECDEMFEEITTHRGFCCAFNYRKAYNSFGEPLGYYKISESLELLGPDFGLSLVLNPEIDEYSYTTIDSEGIEVLIYSQHERPHPTSMKLSATISSPNTVSYIEVSKDFILSTEAVRFIPAFFRACRFLDELFETYHGYYSRGECLALCRQRTIQNLCRCIPFQFISPESDAPQCKLSDLACLNKYKEMLMFINPKAFDESEDLSGLEQEIQDSLWCPECLPNCQKQQFRISKSTSPIGEFSPHYTFLRGLNLTNHSIIHVFYPSGSTSVFVLDVSSTWKQIMISSGGTLALITGFSFVLISEVIYFFTIRLYTHIHENNVKNK